MEKLIALRVRKYASDDNLDMLKKVFEEHGKDPFLYVKEDTNETVLFYCGPLSAKYILEMNCNLSVKNYKGETAITTAYKYARMNPASLQTLQVFADYEVGKVVEYTPTATQLLAELTLPKVQIDPVAKLQTSVDGLHAKLDLLLKFLDVP
jgi:hypothetical protein